MNSQGIRSSVRQSRRELSSLRDGFCSRFARFRRYRSAQDQEAVMREFGLLLLSWGIDGVAAIPSVIRALRLRFLVFGIPAVGFMTAAVWRQTPLSLLAACLIVPPCLLGMFTTAWRISVLRQRRFLPPARWLRECINALRA